MDSSLVLPSISRSRYKMDSTSLTLPLSSRRLSPVQDTDGFDMLNAGTRQA